MCYSRVHLKQLLFRDSFFTDEVSHSKIEYGIRDIPINLVETQTHTLLTATTTATTAYAPLFRKVGREVGIEEPASLTSEVGTRLNLVGMKLLKLWSESHPCRHELVSSLSFPGL